MSSKPLLSLPIPYARPEVDETDIAAVVEVLRSGWLTGGPAIPKLEADFAAYIGAPHAVAVSSGTAALFLSAQALGIQPGDRVITTPLTFVATANCVKNLGGEVVFADIDPTTLNLDLSATRDLLEKAPKGHYKGIIVVDFAGYPAPMDAFRSLADEYGCWLLEDSCHAPGGDVQDTSGTTHRCGDGSLADAAIFSFHPAKHLTSGEGGMITTASEEIAEKARLWRNHSMHRDPEKVAEIGGWYYEIADVGNNYRLSDIHAALAHSQLGKMDTRLARRREIAARYDQAFSGTAVLPAPAAPGHAYHLYIIQAPEKRALFDYLKTQGIISQTHYIPLHLQPLYAQEGWNKGDFPHAEAYYARCHSLPMFPGLREEEQEYVIEKVLGFFS